MKKILSNIVPPTKRPYTYKIVIALLLLNLIGVMMLINRATIGMILSEKVVLINREHLMIDPREDLSEEFIFDSIVKETPYLPIDDLNNIHYKNRNFNNSCAWYPSLLDIKIHNDYWQEFVNRNISYYIFGAYFDVRPSIVYHEPLVRVLTMMHFIARNNEDYPITYCQVWYDQHPKPFIAPVKEMRPIWYYDWGHSLDHHYAHFLSCSVPAEHRNWVPKSVSLVASPCDKATNNVLVTYEPLEEDMKKEKFVVCVKGLDYPYKDMSYRMVEYIETLRSLGASKVVMYKLQVHPNTTKILQYYEDTGFLEYRPFSLSTKVSSLPDLRHMQMDKNGFSYVLHEVIPYNDCFYRNMYRYEYASILDTDEIPMPLGNHSTWHDLMEYGERITNQNCKHFAGYCFRCIYFPRYADKPRYSFDIPEYFYMLQHVQRVREHIRPEWATKCLHHMDRVIAVHNHFPMHYKWDVCPSYSFEASDAQLQHYREPLLKDTLDDPVVDLSLWRFKEQIIARSIKVFEELGFFEEIETEV